MSQEKKSYKDDNQKAAPEEKKSEKFQHQKVAPDVAKEEFMLWLINSRRIKERLLTEKSGDTFDAVEACVNNVIDGTFRINDDGTITHVLAWPIGEDVGDDPIKELTYSKRLPSKHLDGFRKFNNPTSETKTQIVVAALSRMGLQFIKKMETSDLMTVGELIYFYFLG